MNNRVPLGSIVVGVDGSVHGLDAVAWAAAQAARESRPLLLAHATSGGRFGRWRGRVAERKRRTAGARILARALEVAQRAYRESARATNHVDDLRVETACRAADPAALLEELSGRAHLLVVGCRGRGRLGSLVLGSVSSRVADRSQAPVVVVRPQRHSRPQGWVVVATDATADSAGALEFAFRFASTGGRPLTVVHATERPGRHATDIPLEALGEHEEDVVRLLESIAGLRSAYLDVVPELRLVAGSPVAHLVEMSRDADLVVVGAGPHGPIGAAVASVSRAVAESAHCSVAVVHPTPDVDHQVDVPMTRTTMRRTP